MSQQEIEAIRRQELNQPPANQVSTVRAKEKPTGMTRRGDRSAQASGLPKPRRHPGDEEIESGLAR